MFHKQIFASALLMIATLGSATHAGTKFSLPDGTESLFITPPNASGDVAGTCGTPGNLYTHAYGFIRTADGSFTTIDLKSFRHNTLANAIDDNDDVVGQYEDPHDPTSSHAFLRTPDGKITRFDGPNAYDTWPSDANARAGETVGWYYTHDTGNHGFIRTMDGAFTTIDDPDGAGGTYPYAVNASGRVTGTYIDADDVRHGFLRQPDGAFKTVEPPNSIDAENVEINDHGQISGVYQDASSGIFYGFVRDRGTFYISDDSFGRLNAHRRAVGQTFLLSFRHGEFHTQPVSAPKGCSNLFLSGIDDSGLISGTMQCGSRGAWFGYLTTK